MAKWLDQVKKKAGDKGKSPAPSDKEFARKYPAIWEFVSLTQNTDGTTRETSSLLYFIADGCWKVRLFEREQNLTLWAAGETQEEATEALEAMLQSGTAQWRSEGHRTDKKPRK